MSEVRLKAFVKAVHDKTTKALIGYRLKFFLLRRHHVTKRWITYIEGEIDTAIKTLAKAIDFKRAVRRYFNSTGKLPPLFTWAAEFA